MQSGKRKQLLLHLLQRSKVCLVCWSVSFCLSILVMMLSFYVFFLCFHLLIHVVFQMLHQQRLSVGPVVQNFGSDFVKLTCKGNSSSWRVRKFPENGRPYCSNFWLSGESVCTIDTTYSDDGVYWCESMLKEFSNAVNITLQGL